MRARIKGQRLGVFPGVVLLLPLLAGCYAAMVGGMVGMGAAMTLAMREREACTRERRAIAPYLEQLDTASVAVVAEYRVRLEALVMRCKAPTASTEMAELRQDVERLATIQEDELSVFIPAHLPRVRRFLDLLAKSYPGSGT